ncbi:hypothetical protein [Solemya velesiana gill symbiont]|uniref:Uncharacterized protein n=1 Tax=Solemya velesiana gill symbiont TaxID=1918948 RepID=A0A1T2KQG8_9GAMM|nr:hypothetical protein [Solemya velesiana gill symbiont]OOZ34940.1 hypothetical protein BOW51_11770 [Solemya velesiana gill symbiont]
MDKKDIKDAEDYIAAWSNARDTAFEFPPFDTPTSIDHPFMAKLKKDHNFLSAASKSDKCSPGDLAAAVAEGLLTYHDETEQPFTKNTLSQMSNCINRLLTITESTAIFESQSEQMLLIDLLRRLKVQTTPERGFKSGGNMLQQRKLIRSIAENTYGKEVKASTITELAAIIEPDIESDATRKRLDDIHPDEWKEYESDFFDQVLYPYVKLLRKHQKNLHGKNIGLFFT